MPAALQELCELIAGVGISNARKLQQRLEERLRERMPLDPDRTHAVFVRFAFLNWALANGAWSNLENVSLRRDLMATSLRAFALKLAQKVASSQSQSDVAWIAVEIDEQLQQFAKGWTGRMQELEAQGINPDARGAMLYSLELIQEDLDIPDDIMNDIVPGFLQESEDFDEIESVALQTNRAASERQKRGRHG